MDGTKYSPGDWFAVPLAPKAYAVGVIARANPKGILLGYFFGQKHLGLPTLEDVTDLQARDAVLVGRFGYLGLRSGSWPVLGHLETWKSRDWPMPMFARKDALTDRVFRVTYDPDDPGRWLKTEPIGRGERVDYPQDGLMGAEYVEKILSQILC